MNLRLALLLALCGTLVPAPSHSQDTTTARPNATADSTRPVRAKTRAANATQKTGDSSRRVIDGNITIRVGKDEDSTETDRIGWGPRNGVAAGDTVRGDFVNFFGNTDIRGVVLGDAVSLVGDLTVHEGAYVQGDAVSVGGRVRVTGGDVGGNIVTSGRGTWRDGDDEGDEGDDEGRGAARDRDEPHSILGALFAVLIAMAMLGVTGMIAAAVMPHRIDLVARKLEASVGRAFAAGLIIELGFVPILLLVLFTLIVTILGILLIPFAVVALPLLYLVLGALGWFATATLVGRGITGRDGADRPAVMRSLAIGTAVLLLPFALAALLPGWGGGLIALAVGVVWVATTAGFGAAVLSRGGRSPR
ncbi:MAG: hypothetical protein ACO3SD_04965 [Gemmatimonadaceae bacterium]